MVARPLVVHGDFGSPWSLLASVRASALEDYGVPVDWRAVTSPAGPPGFDALRREVDRVLGRLLPDERLPYALAGFATDTRAATHGYAAAYRAGAAATARTTLFAAFWSHAIDLADAAIVHTLLDDVVRVPHTWDDPGADVLARRWAAEWRGFADRALPVVSWGATTLSGPAAVAWLGDEVLRRTSAPASCA
jgi:hypothetical protein